MLENTTIPPFERLESNARSYCRRFPTIFERARGEFLFDTNGRRYIDFLSSAGAVNYGHNNAVLKTALLKYLDQEGPVTSLDLHTTAKQAFLESFEARILAPRALDYKIQFTSPTGTSVVESAVKLARKYTGRTNVVAFTNAFHGMSGVALSVTGNRYHRQPFLPGQVTRLPFDHYLGDGLDTVAYFSKLLTDKSSGIDLPAAIILETIQAEGGVRVASVEWLQSIRAIAKQHGILLIVDDIQVGCGRTGPFFSFEQAAIEPDMVCLSKSLGGLGLPLSVLLLGRNIDVWSPGEDNGTFRGNNLAFITATAALNEYWSNDALQRHVSHLEGVVVRMLRDLKHKYSNSIADVRGRGLIQGIEFCDPTQAEGVAQYCFGAGLIVETCGAEDQVVKLLPPLTISESALRDGLTILNDAVRATLGSGDSRTARAASALFRQ